MRSTSMLGNKNARKKLTDDDVRLIRQAKVEYDRLIAEANKVSARSLAKFMGVHRNTIDKIWYTDYRSEAQ